MTRRRRRLGVALAVMASVSANYAQAQSSPGADAQSSASAASFDFYVLSLSWAPTFCAGASEGRGGAECAPGAKLGFVVHGLWPQKEHGYARDCGEGAPRLSTFALDQARGVYPDVGLARHEWRVHGACSGLSPTAYFSAVSRARAAVAIPAQFVAPNGSQDLAPNAAARAFMQANPRLRPGMFAIVCRRGALEEARICMTKDLRSFRSCPEVVRGMCRAGEMSVPPPH